MVSKGPYMEFIGEKITMSAANTFTEIDISTPVGKSENLAMLIHQISVDVITQLDAPAQGDECVIQVTSATKSSQVNFDDPDLLLKTKRAFGLSTNGGQWFEHTFVKYFSPPILYARSKIYGGMVTTGQGAAKDAGIQIGYTLEKVPQDLFIAALTD